MPGHCWQIDDRIEIYSPSGMPDGRRVQDLDLRNVSSRRRNPIIADKDGATVREDTPILIGTIGMLL